MFFSGDRGGLIVELCNSWPKDAGGFKKRFKELSYEACGLMCRLCNESALGIDFQNGILYLEKDGEVPLLNELVKSKMIVPLKSGTELRGKECIRYSVNPYAFSEDKN